jgi:hypothetical protein
MKPCQHAKTIIWEPHLAGARKCTDCHMVYNPNHTPSWFVEGPSESEQIKILQARVDKLTEALEKISAENKSVGSFSGDLEQNYWRHQELLSREIACKALDEE